MPLNEAEKQGLKDALHKMNNALNSISMQAELARMYIERNDNAKVLEALDTVMAQCRQCSTLTRSTQELFEE
jgi:light-regulated signal transduction histidine kinase (bacteriophytochrome)